MTEKQIEVDLKLLNQILWKYFPWFGLIVFIISSIGFWKIFVKVGRPGWPAIIPLYNVVVLLNIIQRPWWWIFLSFIPIVGALIHIIVLCRLADCFNRSTGFKLGLIMLTPLFLLILGFDKSQYIAPLKPDLPLHPRQL